MARHRVVVRGVQTYEECLVSVATPVVDFREGPEAHCRFLSLVTGQRWGGERKTPSLAHQ